VLAHVYWRAWTGFCFLLAMPLVAAAELAAAPPERRRDRLRKVGALLLGAAMPATVAMVDLVDLSPAHLRGLRGELRMIAAAAVAVTVLGVAVVVLAWWTTLLHLGVAAARWLPAAGAGAVVLVAAVGASRPLRLPQPRRFGRRCASAEASFRSVLVSNINGSPGAIFNDYKGAEAGPP
jgi:hypothetical protein